MLYAMTFVCIFLILWGVPAFIAGVRNDVREWLLYMVLLIIAGAATGLDRFVGWTMKAKQYLPGDTVQYHTLTVEVVDI